MRDISIYGMFHTQCQGCKKLSLERNSVTDSWTCCFFGQCEYQLFTTGRCIGTDNHEDTLCSHDQQKSDKETI